MFDFTQIVESIRELVTALTALWSFVRLFF